MRQALEGLRVQPARPGLADPQAVSRLLQREPLEIDPPDQSPHIRGEGIDEQVQLFPDLPFHRLDGGEL